MKRILDLIVLMMVLLILVGQAGGNNHANKGGGSNYLCLPNDPDNGKPYSYPNDVLYGTEYETGGSAKPSGFDNLQNEDVPCAVCRRRGKSSVLMIPGKTFNSKINFVKQNRMLVLIYIATMISKLCDIPNKTTKGNSNNINMVL